jgi:hypothetical protein
MNGNDSRETKPKAVPDHFALFHAGMFMTLEKYTTLPSWEHSNASQRCAPRQVCDSAFEGFGKPDKHVNGRILFSPFDPSYEIPVAVHYLRERFLGEADLLSACPDGVAELPAMTRYSFACPHP